MRKSIINIITFIAVFLFHSLITWGVLVASTHLIGLNYHITFNFAMGITLLMLYFSFCLNTFRSSNGR